MPSSGFWSTSILHKGTYNFSNGIVRIELYAGGSFTYNGITYTSDNGCLIVGNRVERGTVSVPTDASNDPTPPRQDDYVVVKGSTGQIILSEIMFESEGGINSLPQWIELYNTTNTSINIRGWQLEFYRRQPELLDATITFQTDFVIPAKQSRLVVSTSASKSGQNNLDEIYNLFSHHSKVLDQSGGQNRNRLIARGGFYLKLSDGRDKLIDHIGTVADNANEPTWELPDCDIDGVRSSMIRRFDYDTARNGMERAGWIRAWDTKTKPTGRWYGRASDIGTPAFRSSNNPLPVELSTFSAHRVDGNVIVSWTTESELNNAGFNIYRSESKTDEFRQLNAKLIQGAGTTGERTEYRWTDTTAKTDTAYYYQIEDISHAGIAKQLATVRLRGFVSASRKLTTNWGELKMKK